MKISPTLALALLAAMILRNDVQAQDIHFSQFYDHGMVRNPALTGIYNGDYKMAVNYRNQWSNIGVPFQTLLASAESRLGINEANDCVSYGLTASVDRAGSAGLTTLSLMPSFSYNKSLEDDQNTYLSVGFSGAYIQRSVDVSKMTYASQFINNEYSAGNPSNEQIPANKTRNWDLSAGVSINSFAGKGERKTARYYAGVAVYHITRPRQSFFDNSSLVNLNMKWSAQAGFSAFINPQFIVSAHANYYNQHPHTETIFGSLLGWLRPQGQDARFFLLQAGLFYRLKDAIIPTVKLDYNQVSCTFSYDINTSGLRNATNGLGGPEISLIYKGIITRRALKDKLRCPQKCPRMDLLDNTQMQ